MYRDEVIMVPSKTGQFSFNLAPCFRRAPSSQSQLSNDFIAASTVDVGVDYGEQDRDLSPLRRILAVTNTVSLAAGLIQYGRPYYCPDVTLFGGLQRQEAVRAARACGRRSIGQVLAGLPSEWEAHTEAIPRFTKSTLQIINSALPPSPDATGGYEGASGQTLGADAFPRGVIMELDPDTFIASWVGPDQIVPYHFDLPLKDAVYGGCLQVLEGTLGIQNVPPQRQPDVLN